MAPSLCKNRLSRRKRLKLSIFTVKFIPNFDLKEIK